MRQLISTVGTGDYDEEEYFLLGDPSRFWRTRFAPVATAHLAGRIDKVLLVLTKDAHHKHWGDVSKEFEGSEIRAEMQEIPVGRNEEEMWEIVKILADSVDAEAEKVVDITHALRHLPVLLLAALAYLGARGGKMIGEIYYAAKEASPEKGVPLFNLAPFVDLIDAYHGVRQFRESGNADHLAKYLDRVNARQWGTRSGSSEFSRFSKRLQKLSNSLVMALPLESGIYGRCCWEVLDGALGHLDSGERYFLGWSLINTLKPMLEKIAIGYDVNEKSSIRLDMKELDRQLEVIRFLFETRAYDKAVILLREWIVSRCILAAGMADRWLDRDECRHPVERALNALPERAIEAKNSLTEGQMKLVGWWNRTRELRNAFAHAGMGEKPLSFQKLEEKVCGLIEEIEENAESPLFWEVDVHTMFKDVLLTPLGLSPGVLYTALERGRFDRAIVVTSREARVHIGEACERAAFDPEKVQEIVVEDARCCFTEADRLVRTNLVSLISANRLTVNVTGGTTALQYVVERMARKAERYGVDVRHIALVDERTAEEQVSEPYVVGRMVVLEK